MKEYFFVKVQIGIIAERGVFLKLIDEIESLIDMHQEGAYWDFKREWYGNNKDGDMLIDIICMANNLETVIQRMWSMEISWWKASGSDFRN